MSLTNAATSAAATIHVTVPNTDLRLLGIFQTAEDDYVLLQTSSRDIIKLSTSTPEGDLQLVGVQEGYALIKDAGTIRRLFVT